MVAEQDNSRFFYGPDDLKYYIAAPTAEDIRGADWQYSKVYTQCLIEGITTSAEMMDILNRRGIIGPEFEQRVRELSDNLREKIQELEKSTDMDVKRELSYSVAHAREELFQWNQRLNGPMNNTAEQISDDARLEYLTSAMILDSSNNKVWSSYDVYLKEKSQALALKARFEVMLYLQGLDPDFMDKTPEAVAMREVQQDIMDKAEAIIRASEAVIEEETNMVQPIIDEAIAVEDTQIKKKKSTKTEK